MNKKLIKFYFLILLLSFLIVSIKTASAGTTITYIPQIKGITGDKLTFDNTTKTLATYIKDIYNYGVGVAAIVATIVLMIGGFQWLTSGGSGEKVGEAKAWITAALSGLVLVLSSYMILDLINPNLVNFKILTVKNIEKIKEAEGSPDSSGGLSSSAMTSNVAAYDSILKKEADKIGVPCHVLKAILMKESTGNPNATGPDLPKKPEVDKNAIGLMQLLPSTAGLSRSDLYDPAKNIHAGATYFSKLMLKPCNNSRKIVSDTKFNTVCNGSDLNFVIAAYNAGPGWNKESASCPGMTVWQCPDNKNFQQTRDYVKIVNANIQKITTTPGWNCD